MGAWGTKAFDNDDANDWAYSLEKVTDLSLVKEAFDAVEFASDYIAAPVACNALAACEVLARLLGNTGYQNSYTEKVDVWVKAHPQMPPEDVLAQARIMTDLILGPQSELNELWEGDEHEAWRMDVQDLKKRLQN